MGIPIEATWVHISDSEKPTHPVEDPWYNQDEDTEEVEHLSVPTIVLFWNEENGEYERKLMIHSLETDNWFELDYFENHQPEYWLKIDLPPEAVLRTALLGKGIGLCEEN